VIIPSRVSVSPTTTQHTLSHSETRPIVTSPRRTRHSIMFSSPCADNLTCLRSSLRAPRRAFVLPPFPRCLKTGPSLPAFSQRCVWATAGYGNLACRSPLDWCSIQDLRPGIRTFSAALRACVHHPKCQHHASGSAVRFANSYTCGWLPREELQLLGPVNSHVPRIRHRRDCDSAMLAMLAAASQDRQRPSRSTPVNSRNVRGYDAVK
jgi:hypothetical protein